MITMEPVLKHGRTVWDRALLPEDEFRERLAAVRAGMDRAGLEATVVIGHAADHGNLSFLTGLVPKMGWTAMVVGNHGDPTLLSMSGPRELPSLRSLTWLSDVRTSQSLFSGAASGLLQAVRDHAEEGRAIGLIGARENLNHAAYCDVIAALGRYELRNATEVVSGPRERKRPREVVALRRARTLAREAVDAARRSFEEGMSNTGAVMVADRVARMGGAHDVRLLANIEGNDFAPPESRSLAHSERLALYCAVEFAGYWGEAAVNAPSGHESTAADRAVQAMMESVTPSAPVAKLIQAAIDQLPDGGDDIALSYGLGGGIGLAVTESPVLRREAAQRIVPGSVLTLRALTREKAAPVCATETLVVGVDGKKAL